MLQKNTTVDEVFFGINNNCHFFVLCCQAQKYKNIFFLSNYKKLFRGFCFLKYKKFCQAWARKCFKDIFQGKVFGMNLKSVLCIYFSQNFPLQIFDSMTVFWICRGFRIYQSSDYAKVLNIQFCFLKIRGAFWRKYKRFFQGKILRAEARKCSKVLHSILLSRAPPPPSTIL